LFVFPPVLPQLPVLGASANPFFKFSIFIAIQEELLEHMATLPKKTKKSLQNTDKSKLARALTRLAQLNQSKVYLFWKKKRSTNLYSFNG
jgi:hypothetical protein